MEREPVIQERCVPPLWLSARHPEVYKRPGEPEFSDLVWSAEPAKYGTDGIRATVSSNIKISYFADNHDPKGTEANTVLNLPLEKTIGKEFAFDLGFTADLTHYNLPSHPMHRTTIFIM